MTFLMLMSRLSWRIIFGNSAYWESPAHDEILNTAVLLKSILDNLI